MTNEIITLQDRLIDCENRIASSWQTCADALAEVRDDKLYRNQYDTFQRYCTERWGYTPQYARRLIEAGRTVHLLEKETIVSILPANEAQTKPLTKLPEDQRASIWKQAVDSAPRNEDGDPIITAKHVAEVVDSELAKVEKVDAKDAKRETAPPPTQDMVDVRTIRKAFGLIAEVAGSMTGSRALEKFSYEAFGDKADAACDWMADFIGTHRGKTDIGIRHSGGYFHPSDEQVRNWQAAYPHIDVEAELRKCAAWNDANSEKRKTPKGIHRHVNQWLSRADENAAKAGQANGREREHMELTL